MQDACDSGRRSATLVGSNVGGKLSDSRHRGGSAGPALTWVQSTEQLNRAPLLARDPILFYDEVPLYESELDDNGVARLSVKARRCTLCR